MSMFIVKHTDGFMTKKTAKKVTPKADAARKFRDKKSAEACVARYKKRGWKGTFKVMAADKAA